MSVYIYTLPKAGTYFLAALLDNLGLNDTGYHLTGSNSYLDTRVHSLSDNATTPHIANVDTFFVPLVRKSAPDDVLFGHFPLPRNPHVVPKHMRFLCAYRDPRKTLLSEFVDFRFRRDDIAWLSRETLPDDVAAFEHYLDVHGTTAHFTVFRNILLYHAQVTHPFAMPAEADRVLFLHFDQVLRQPDEVLRIASFIGRDLTPEAAHDIHAKTLATETKTKAVTIDIDRQALWSDRAEAIFAASDFPKAIDLARAQGLEV